LFFSRRNDININNIIIGENTERKAYCWIPIGTHAEIDALTKMRYEFKRKKRFETLNMIVLRFSRYGTLGYARPCYHCLKQLQQAKFLNIKKIYYSEATGNITSEKFIDMLKSPKTYISNGYMYRNKQQKPKNKSKNKNKKT